MNASESRLAQRNPQLEIQSAYAGTSIHQQRITSRPRVLFVINSLEGGGAERVFSLLVNGIQPLLAVADIDVLLLDDKPDRFEIDASINSTCLKSNGGLLDSAWRFRRHVATCRPQVVVSFLPRANYLATAFARHYNYRCIISERTNTSGRLRHGIAGWLEKRLVRALYPRAHRVVACAQGVSEGLTTHYGVAPEATCVIHNPFDLTRIAELAQQADTLQQYQRQIQHGFIVAVGRLTHVKRFDLLIRAYALGDFKQPLVILGEGPQLAELKELALELGVSERVLFPGFMANPYAIVAQASVFVLSSDREGFPNCLVEAMAVGLPVIATNCHHGPAEILDDVATLTVAGVHQGKYGLLVPTNDADALAQALRQVLADQAMRKSLAESAKLRAQQFTISAALSGFAAVINEQLALAGQVRE